MFTAITITKTFLKAFVGTRWGQKLWLFGVKENAQERKTINFMKASPIFLEKSIVGEKKDFPAAETRANTISATPEEQIDLVNSQIVSSGENTFIIKTKYLSNETHEKILISLKEKLGAAEELRFTTIGSVVGKSMQQRAIMAIIAACLMIAFYLAFAFRKIPKHVNPWRFGVAAVIALIHDVWITVAIFIVLGRFFNFEMDVMFITALLTVLGFSVHDTIVVYDRL
ncbi:hypothetical protein HZC21_05405, partial [Candidatus Peregrinibacteria bacterium]|nr:hypothetical protein [Candidatus Peregrinibacteria bacterium]